MSRFLLIFSSCILLLAAYMGLRLASHWLHWASLGALVFFVLLFPAFHWLQEETKAFQVWLQRLGFFSLGILSWLFVLAVARDLYLFAAFLAGGSEAAISVAGSTKGFVAFGFAAFFTLAGSLWAFKGLRVREVDVPIRNLPSGLDGLKIAQITDLHIGPTIGESYVRRVVEMSNGLKPDITVLTGDIIDGDFVRFRAAIRLLGDLEPFGRVFFVPGNHDYYWRFHEAMEELERLGIKVLRNQGQKLESDGGEIWVGGVTDPVGKTFGEAPDVAAAAKGGEGSDFHLLLSHRPELVKDAFKYGFDLQLSGHTHGGQFFPWTFVASRVHEYFLGLMKYRETWIYVSPGTGTWGPPVRVGTTPEVTLIRVGKETAPERKLTLVKGP